MYVVVLNTLSSKLEAPHCNAKRESQISSKIFENPGGYRNNLKTTLPLKLRATRLSLSYDNEKQTRPKRKVQKIPFYRFTVKELEKDDEKLKKIVIPRSVKLR